MVARERMYGGPGFYSACSKTRGNNGTVIKKNFVSVVENILNIVFCSLIFALSVLEIQVCKEMAYFPGVTRH